MAGKNDNFDALMAMMALKHIWEDGEIYCVGLVFSIEDLK